MRQLTTSSERNTNTVTPQLRSKIAAAILKDCGNPKFTPITDYTKLFDAHSSPEHCSVIFGDTPSLTAVPPEVSDLALAVFSHECGHIAHNDYGGIMRQLMGIGQIETEYKASMWGFRKIKEHGGIVTPAMRICQRTGLASYWRSYPEEHDSCSPAIHAFMKGKTNPPSFYGVKGDD
jgi:hypothetical protein